MMQCAHLSKALKGRIGVQFFFKRQHLKHHWEEIRFFFQFRSFIKCELIEKNTYSHALQMCMHL